MFAVLFLQFLNIINPILYSCSTQTLQKIGWAKSRESNRSFFQFDSGSVALNFVPIRFWFSDALEITVRLPVPPSANQFKPVLKKEERPQLPVVKKKRLVKHGVICIKQTHTQTQKT